MNPLHSALSSIISLAGIPKPVAQIVTTIAPKMFAGTITVPEIISAVLCYAIEDAKKIIDKNFKEKFKANNVKAYYWLVLFEREGEVWASTLMQNYANAQKNNFYREEKGNHWFTDSEQRLEPFLAEQLKQISTHIKPKNIKRDYATLIEFLKHQSQIPSETVDYILNLIVQIFSTPEPFLDVIMSAFSGNAKALYNELKSENWYVNLENLSFITGVQHEGVCIYAHTTHFCTTTDPLSHKKRTFIPVGEFFEKMLLAPPTYYEKNFEAILATIIPAGTPPEAHAHAHAHTTVEGQASQENATTAPESPTSDSPQKKNVIQFVPRTFPHLHSK
jgi:hypothetical protein